MTHQPPSRRAAQRLAREIREEQAEVPVLPENLESLLVGYRVDDVDDADWALAQPALVDIMRRSHIRGEASFRKHLTVVAQYFVYRVRHGLDLDPEVALSATQIDRYYLHGLPDKGEQTRNDYRSRLNKIADHVVLGAGAPVKAPSLGHQSVRPGYGTVEEARIRRVAKRQRSQLRRRQMCAITGLTMGAGLGPTDLRALYASDVIDHGVDGIEVRVTGQAPRVTWVRRSYEELVRIGLEGLSPDQLVIGEQVDRRNITTGILRQADTFDAPDLDASRMRSTWLSWLLRQRIPIQVILQASGLKTARTLTELAELIDDVDGDTSSMLRGDVQ